MSTSYPTQGTCTHCGRVMTRGGMTRHLQACPVLQERRDAAEQSSRPEAHLFHLQAISGAYWLHLEMTGSASLKTLDRYLRAIWLECCGHMSSFSLGRSWRGRDVGMSRKAEQVLEPGVELVHTYDFGTTSETLVNVVAMRWGRALTRHPLALLARNEPPEATCVECGKRAKWLCLECVYEHDEDGTLCKEHGEAHLHEEYGDLMPLVNSPRVGLCGYEGPAEPPY